MTSNAGVWSVDDGVPALMQYIKPLVAVLVLLLLLRFTLFVSFAVLWKGFLRPFLLRRSFLRQVARLLFWAVARGLPASVRPQRPQGVTAPSHQPPSALLPEKEGTDGGSISSTELAAVGGPRHSQRQKPPPLDAVADEGAPTANPRRSFSASELARRLARPLLLRSPLAAPTASLPPPRLLGPPQGTGPRDLQANVARPRPVLMPSPTPHGSTPPAPPAGSGDGPAVSRRWGQRLLVSAGTLVPWAGRVCVAVFVLYLAAAHAEMSFFSPFPAATVPKLAVECGAWTALAPNTAGSFTARVSEMLWRRLHPCGRLVTACAAVAAPATGSSGCSAYLVSLHEGSGASLGAWSPPACQWADMQAAARGESLEAAASSLAMEPATRLFSRLEEGLGGEWLGAAPVRGSPLLASASPLVLALALGAAVVGWSTRSRLLVLALFLLLLPWGWEVLQLEARRSSPALSASLALHSWPPAPGGRARLLLALPTATGERSAWDWVAAPARCALLWAARWVSLPAHSALTVVGPTTVVWRSPFPYADALLHQICEEEQEEVGSESGSGGGRDALCRCASPGEGRCCRPPHVYYYARHRHVRLAEGTRARAIETTGGARDRQRNEGDGAPTTSCLPRSGVCWWNWTLGPECTRSSSGFRADVEGEGGRRGMGSLVQPSQGRRSCADVGRLLAAFYSGSPAAPQTRAAWPSHRYFVLDALGARLQGLSPLLQPLPRADHLFLVAHASTGTGAQLSAPPVRRRGAVVAGSSSVPLKPQHRGAWREDPRVAAAAAVEHSILHCYVRFTQAPRDNLTADMAEAAAAAHRAEKQPGKERGNVWETNAAVRDACLLFAADPTAAPSPPVGQEPRRLRLVGDVRLRFFATFSGPGYPLAGANDTVVVAVEVPLTASPIAAATATGGGAGASTYRSSEKEEEEESTTVSCKELQMHLSHRLDAAIGEEEQEGARDSSPTRRESVGREGLRRRLLLSAREQLATLVRCEDGASSAVAVESQLSPPRASEENQSGGDEGEGGRPAPSRATAVPFGVSRGAVLRYLSDQRRRWRRTLQVLHYLERLQQGEEEDTRTPRARWFREGQGLETAVEQTRRCLNVSEQLWGEWLAGVWELRDPITPETADEWPPSGLVPPTPLSSSGRDPLLHAGPQRTSAVSGSDESHRREEVQFLLVLTRSAACSLYRQMLQPLTAGALQALYCLAEGWQQRQREGATADPGDGEMVCRSSLALSTTTSARNGDAAPACTVAFSPPRLLLAHTMTMEVEAAAVPPSRCSSERVMWRVGALFRAACGAVWRLLGYSVPLLWPVLAPVASLLGPAASCIWSIAVLPAMLCCWRGALWVLSFEARLMLTRYMGSGTTFTSQWLYTAAEALVLVLSLWHTWKEKKEEEQRRAPAPHGQRFPRLVGPSASGSTPGVPHRASGDLTAPRAETASEDSGSDAVPQRRAGMMGESGGWRPALWRLIPSPVISLATPSALLAFSSPSWWRRVITPSSRGSSVSPSTPTWHAFLLRYREPIWRYASTHLYYALILLLLWLVAFLVHGGGALLLGWLPGWSVLAGGVGLMKDVMLLVVYPAAASTAAARLLRVVSAATKEAPRHGGARSQRPSHRQPQTLWKSRRIHWFCFALSVLQSPWAGLRHASAWLREAVPAYGALLRCSADCLCWISVAGGHTIGSIVRVLPLPAPRAAGSVLWLFLLRLHAVVALEAAAGTVGGGVRLVLREVLPLVVLGTAAAFLSPRPRTDPPAAATMAHLETPSAQPPHEDLWRSTLLLPRSSLVYCVSPSFAYLLNALSRLYIYIYIYRNVMNLVLARSSPRRAKVAVLAFSARMSCRGGGRDLHQETLDVEANASAPGRWRTATGERDEEERYGVGVSGGRPQTEPPRAIGTEYGEFQSNAAHLPRGPVGRGAGAAQRGVPLALLHVCGDAEEPGEGPGAGPSATLETPPAVVDIYLPLPCGLSVGLRLDDVVAGHRDGYYAMRTPLDYLTLRRGADGQTSAPPDHGGADDTARYDAAVAQCPAAAGGERSDDLCVALHGPTVPVALRAQVSSATPSGCRSRLPASYLECYQGFCGWLEGLVLDDPCLPNTHTLDESLQVESSRETASANDNLLVRHVVAEAHTHGRDRQIPHSCWPLSLCFSFPLFLYWSKGGWPLARQKHPLSPRSYPKDLRLLLQKIVKIVLDLAGSHSGRLVVPTLFLCVCIPSLPWRHQSGEVIAYAPLHAEAERTTSPPPYEWINVRVHVALMLSYAHVSTTQGPDALARRIVLKRGTPDLYTYPVALRKLVLCWFPPKNRSVALINKIHTKDLKRLVRWTPLLPGVLCRLDVALHYLFIVVSPFFRSHEKELRFVRPSCSHVERATEK
eukprot:gene11556-7963_t